MRNLSRIGRGFILLGLLLTTLPANAFEYTHEGNTLEYTVLGTGENVTYVSVQQVDKNKPGNRNKAPKGDLLIPSTFQIDNTVYEVTMVAGSGFAYCREITSVDLPQTVTMIDDKGFYSCDKMTSISLKDGLRMIGDRAFCNDSALQGTLEIPGSVDTIADYAFGKCLSLKNIRFASATPAKVGGAWVFLQTIANAHILIPCGTYEAYAAYYYSVAYADGTIAFRYFWRDKVTDLCDDKPIFSDDKLRYRVIDNKEKNEEKNEVSVCGYLSNTIDGELQIPESVEVAGNTYYVVEVDSNVFNQRELSHKNVRITSLVLPSTMRKLNYCAFRCCHSLASVTLNEGLKYIGNRAFCKDSLLTNITIPSTVEFMGDYAIGDCPNLQWVEMLPPTPPASDGGPLSGVPYMDKCDVAVACGTKNDTENGYNTTRPWAYRVVDVCNFNKNNLKFSRTSASDTAVQVNGFVTPKAGALQIPATVRAGKYNLSVTKVAAGAFAELNRGGHWLTSLEIPGSVRHIDNAAFRNCVNLTKVRLHEGIQVIGNRAFCADSALTMVTIPSTVDSLGGYAFGVCPNLSVIYALGPTPPKRQEGDSNPFNGVSETGTLIIHCPDLEAYKTAWKGILTTGWEWGDNCEMDIYHHNYPNAGSLLTEVEGNVDVYHIMYHRIFTSGQWETLYLPFDVDETTPVTLYDADDNAEYPLTPWKKDVGGNFWLLKQEGTEDGYPKFVTTDKVEGNTPYLIQFKQDYYDDKTVTFHSAGNPEVGTKFSVQWGNISAMYGNNTLMPQSVGSVYLLEEDGTTFYGTSAARTLHPFECYVTEGSGSETMVQSRRFAIRYRESVPTGNSGSLPQIDGSEMLCKISGNTLTIETNGEAVNVYSINGTLLYTFPQGTTTAAMDLESGYYIVTTQYGSQKVVL